MLYFLALDQDTFKNIELKGLGHEEEDLKLVLGKLVIKLYGYIILHNFITLQR